MRIQDLISIGLLAMALAGCAGQHEELLPLPAIAWDPERYVCYRSGDPIVVDGKLDDDAWGRAAWTGEFVDIRGGDHPAPRLRTRAKMLWDERYFYVAAELEEPHVWGKLTERDAVIYYDPDFEVFIDPDGDTHDYYELEINALGTEWDLMLTRPYRDDGTAIDAWDIDGLITAVDVDGTLNDPADTDRGWSVEIAIPWDALREHAHRPSPPAAGDQWRVGFSRVEWTVDTRDGETFKRTDAATGRPLAEDNWVWSAQGLVNMHYPELWGFVQFSDRVAGKGAEAFVVDPRDLAAWNLRTLYYAQRHHHTRHGAYAGDPAELDWTAPQAPPRIELTDDGYEAVVVTGDGVTLRLDQHGRVWE